MRQQTERFRFGKRIIFWDPRQGAAPRALTSRAVDCLRFRPEISLHCQMDEALSLIEAYPWADIFVSDRWVPLILELAAQNLHLCLHAAILHLPAESVSSGSEHLGLSAVPLAFPSVVIHPEPERIGEAVDAWGSLRCKIAAAGPLQDDVEAAFALFDNRQATLGRIN